MESAYQKIGNQLGKEIANEIIKNFRRRFFDEQGVVNWKGKKIPGWVNLKENFQTQKTSKNVFGEVQFSRNDKYYVYIEFAKELYLSTTEKIKQFYDEKPVWVEMDTYIFPQNMNWCVFITHDDDFFLTIERK